MGGGVPVPRRPASSNQRPGWRAGVNQGTPRGRRRPPPRRAAEGGLRHEGGRAAAGVPDLGCCRAAGPAPARAGRSDRSSGPRTGASGAGTSRIRLAEPAPTSSPSPGVWMRSAVALPGVDFRGRKPARPARTSPEMPTQGASWPCPPVFAGSHAPPRSEAPVRVQKCIRRPATRTALPSADPAGRQGASGGERCPGIQAEPPPPPARCPPAGRGRCPEETLTGHPWRGSASTSD